MNPIAIEAARRRRCYSSDLRIERPHFVEIFISFHSKVLETCLRYDMLLFLKKTILTGGTVLSVLHQYKYVTLMEKEWKFQNILQTEKLLNHSYKSGVSFLCLISSPLSILILWIIDTYSERI